MIHFFSLKRKPKNLELVYLAQFCVFYNGAMWNVLYFFRIPRFRKNENHTVDTFLWFIKYHSFSVQCTAHCKVAIWRIQYSPNNFCESVTTESHTPTNAKVVIVESWLKYTCHSVNVRASWWWYYITLNLCFMYRFFLQCVSNSHLTPTAAHDENVAESLFHSLWFFSNSVKLSKGR